MISFEIKIALVSRQTNRVRDVSAANVKVHPLGELSGMVSGSEVGRGHTHQRTLRQMGLTVMAASSGHPLRGAANP